MGRDSCTITGSPGVARPCSLPMTDALLDLPTLYTNFMLNFIFSCFDIGAIKDAPSLTCPGCIDQERGS